MGTLATTDRGTIEFSNREIKVVGKDYSEYQDCIELLSGLLGVEKDLSFSITPAIVKPEEDVTLLFNEPTEELTVYLAGRSLPKKTTSDGRRMVVTVPDGMPSGIYDIEVDDGNKRAQSLNALQVKSTQETKFGFILAIESGEFLIFICAETMGESIDGFQKNQYLKMGMLSSSRSQTTSLVGNIESL